MMRRLLAALALLAPFLVVFAIQAPAHAYNWSSHRTVNDCWQCADEDVNLEVTYQRDMDNKGFKLESVTIEGCYLPCASVDGKVLKCTNQNGTVVWSKPGDQINLGSADEKLWVPNLIMPNATELWCYYSGRANERLSFDKDFSLTIGRT